MNRCRRYWALTAFAVLLISSFASSAEATTITIRSWDTANQRGSDLASAVGEYSALRAALLGHGDTILAGVSTLTGGSLTGIDAFFWGTSSHVLSGAEATALSTFVNGGGVLILETNSLVSEQTSANSGYNALGLGSRAGALGNGAQSATSGTFTGATTATTVGEFGDIRNGTFASSAARIIDPTGATSVGTWGTTVPNTTWVEFSVGAGKVLGVGDPYGFDLFSAGSFANLNNQKGYMNFLHQSSAVPEPVSLVLLGGGLLGLLAFRRRGA